MRKTYFKFFLILFSFLSFASYVQGNLLSNADEQKTIVSYGESLRDLGDEISTQVTMFDFVDINGQVQSYGFTNKIL